MTRRTLPGLLASVVTAVLALHVATAPASSAAPEPELIAESLNDGGLYVDSGAKYFTGDAAKDRLRAQLETARRPVFVAVLPAGSSLTPAQMYGLVKRKGTFAVLNGGSLKASSNVLPSGQLRTALSGALKDGAGDPAGALVSFVRLTNGTPRTNTTTQARQPTPEATVPDEATEEATPVSDGTTATSAAKKDDDGSSLPMIIGGVLLVVLLAAGGFLVWRRRNRTGDAIG